MTIQKWKIWSSVVTRLEDEGSNISVNQKQVHRTLGRLTLLL